MHEPSPPSHNSPGSREAILRALRARSMPPAELPSLEQSWVRYDDPLAQFEQMVASVGGRTVRVDSTSAILSALAESPHYAMARRVVSTVPGIEGNVDLAGVEDPHLLADVDWAILPGEFGVAENGAVWVSDAGLRQRAIYFIVQHLALVVPRREIVDNLHQAYGRVELGKSSLGLWISGPSKTADIEQSLVIGAHGPRSLTLFLLGE